MGNKFPLMCFTLLCCYHETSERNEVLLFVTKNHLEIKSSSVFGGHITKQNFSSAEGGALQIGRWETTNSPSLEPNFH
jgi:hypothetical protein